MDEATRANVRRRAENRCEYCRIHQRYYPDSTFHIEHIIARQHGGVDDPSNLALACHLCNSKKGPNLTGIDPETDQIIRLYNPRVDVWGEHFRREQYGYIVGLTGVGRATVAVLNINAAIRTQIRHEIALIEAATPDQ